jgi:alkyl hydroperoxide reductase subunit AhpF
VPAIVVEGTQDYGIRFIGIPSGYEFMSLLDAVKAVSSGDSGLSEESRQLLAEVKEPLTLQVFVTPT